MTRWACREVTQWAKRTCLGGDSDEWEAKAKVRNTLLRHCLRHTLNLVAFIEKLPQARDPFRSLYLFIFCYCYHFPQLYRLGKGVKKDSFAQVNIILNPGYLFQTPCSEPVSPTLSLNWEPHEVTLSRKTLSGIIVRHHPTRDRAFRRKP